MKKYEVYLSDMVETYLDNNKCFLKSDTIFMDTIEQKDLLNIRSEHKWNLVDDDYVEKMGKMKDRTNKVIELLEHCYCSMEGFIQDSNDDNNWFQVEDIVKMLKGSDK